MTKTFKTMIQCVAGACLLALVIGCQPPASDDNLNLDVSVDTGVPEASAVSGSSNMTESTETPDNNTTTGSETPEGGETPE